MTGMHSGSKLAEFKSELESGGDAVRDLVRRTLQEILEEEMTGAAVGAAKSERTSDRPGYRSGYCKRHLTTRVGRIELRVPQDRNGASGTELFERYERSEKAFVSALMQMQVHGFRRGRSRRRRRLLRRLPVRRTLQKRHRLRMAERRVLCLARHDALCRACPDARRPPFASLPKPTRDPVHAEPARPRLQPSNTERRRNAKTQNQIKPKKMGCTPTQKRS